MKVKIQNIDEKKLTKETRVLRLLKREKRVTNWELSKISLRYGAVIHTLRKEGHEIATIRINDDGLFNYSYLGWHEVKE